MKYACKYQLKLGERVQRVLFSVGTMPKYACWSYVIVCCYVQCLDVALTNDCWEQCKIHKKTQQNACGFIVLRGSRTLQQSPSGWVLPQCKIFCPNHLPVFSHCKALLCFVQMGTIAGNIYRVLCVMQDDELSTVYYSIPNIAMQCLRLHSIMGKRTT